MSVPLCFPFLLPVYCARHMLTCTRAVDMEGSSEIFTVILWLKIFSAGAPEQRDSKRTQLVTRQIGLSGLNGEDYAEE